jgi:hypothetical protein
MKYLRICQGHFLGQCFQFINQSHPINQLCITYAVHISVSGSRIQFWQLRFISPEYRWATIRSDNRYSITVPKIYRHCNLVDVSRCVWSSFTFRWLASGQLTWGFIWLISALSNLWPNWHTNRERSGFSVISHRILENLIFPRNFRIVPL